MKFFSACLLWLVFALFARGVEVIDGPQVEADETSASLTWKTDVACGASVRFGTNPKNLDQKKNGAKASPGTDHALSLSGLQPGTTYHAEIGTAKLPLKRITFQTQGSAPANPKASPKPPPVLAPPVSTASKGLPSPLPSAPPARETWGYLDSLSDHFERHGQDFHARDAEDYAAQAWLFLQRATRDGLPAKVDEERVIRVWDPKTRSFAAYTPQGKTKTYFKPNDPTYFDRQPGKPVRLKPRP